MNTHRRGEAKRARRQARIADRVNHPEREAERLRYHMRLLERGAERQGAKVA